MRAAIVSCDGPTEADHQSGMVIDALERAGHNGEVVVWSDPGVDWSAYDVAWIS